MTIKEEIEALKATNEHLANIIELQVLELNKLNDKINYLIDYQTGDWEIKNKQMLFYSRDGILLEKYSLLNANNNPTNTSVFKRVRL